ncbi:hypothetical protein RRF57_005022 [Xylaria bambusicola]|uniref:Uncharacterized protein n=1 Tax=Xylaria bambusicola TaxID=326684 RepID=A0AAN7UIU5_9PEZI
MTRQSKVNTSDAKMIIRDVDLLNDTVMSSRKNLLRSPLGLWCVVQRLNIQITLNTLICRVDILRKIDCEVGWVNATRKFLIRDDSAFPNKISRNHITEL